MMNEAEEFLQDNDCVDIPISYWSTEEVKYVSELMQSYADEQLKKKMPKDDEIKEKAFESKTANDISVAFLNMKRKYFIKVAKWLKQQILKQ